MEQVVKIISIKQVTHDVKCFRVAKPSAFDFIPGQATDLSINKPGLNEEKRPFTFTALNKENYLEFTIKGYRDHHGVTDKLHHLEPGDELIVRDSWGAIEYKGPGYFIAGGAGITPFIAILRQLKEDGKLADNSLFFSNKTAEDIIYEDELSAMLGHRAVFVLTAENNPAYHHTHIDEDFIRNHVTDFTKHFYICGPDAMMQELTPLLEKLGANTDAVIFEK